MVGLLDQRTFWGSGDRDVRNFAGKLFSRHCGSVSVLYQPALLILCVTPNISHGTLSQRSMIQDRKNPGTQGLLHKSLCIVLCNRSTLNLQNIYFSLLMFIYIFSGLFLCIHKSE